MATTYTAGTGNTVTISGKTAPATLHFPDASSQEDFSVSRDGNHVVINGGGGVVKILQNSYANGRYTITFDTGNPQTLGLLTRVWDGKAPTPTAGDDVVISLGDHFQLEPVINGGDGDDSMYGVRIDEKFAGGSGDDFISAGDGSDTISGGDGNDIIIAGGGADFITGAKGNDILNGGSGRDTYIFFRGNGDDTIVAENTQDKSILKFKDVSSIDNFSFSIGTGENAGDIIITITTTDSSGDNELVDSVTIKQSAYANGKYVLKYGSGDTDVGPLTVLQPGGRWQQVSTGLTVGTNDGDRINIIYTAGDVIIFGGGGNDNIDSGGNFGGDFIAYGGIGDDTIQAGNGINKIYGGEGDDTFNSKNLFLDALPGERALFVGGAGADTFSIGTSLYDTVSYESSPDSNGDGIGVTVYLGGGTGEGDDAEGDTFRENLIYGGSGVDILIGSKFADTLVGDFKANTLIGGNGNDILKGLGGDDILEGGTGNDILEGGKGNDIFDGGGGTNTISYEDSEEGVTVNLGTGEFSGGDAGGDSIREVNGSTTHITNLIGSGESDILTGDAEDNIIEGGVGDDTLYGGEGTDTLKGGAGVDTYIFEDGDGEEIIEGDADGGKIYFKSAASASNINAVQNADDPSIVTITAGRVSVTINNFVEGVFTLHYGSGDTEVGPLIFEVNTDGTERDDTLLGSEEGETFDGKEGNDIIQALGGDDIIDGGTGTDTLLGGDGTDTYIFESGDGSDTITDDGGILQFKNAAGIESFTFSRDNAGGVTIAVGSDSVTLNDFTDGKYFLHYGSIDTLLGRLTVADTAGGTISATDDDVTDLIVGLAGVDILQGDAGIDLLLGGANDDMLTGGAGNDFLYGGAGSDTYVFETGYGTDTIEDTGGGELYFKDATGIDSFQFSRNEQNDVVVSTAGGDSVIVKEFSDNRYILFHEDGEDRKTESGHLYVGDGDGNTFIGSAAKDLMIGLAGVDILRGGGGGDELYGGSDDDELYGDAGTDTLRGGDNNDKLYGGDDADILYGGAGNDTLTGGAGDDTLTGGAGDDTYVFESGYGNDTITDDGGKLYFKAAAGIESFAFSREGDNLKITVGSDSVTIEDFANGEYTLHYGTDDTPLGRISLATTAGGALSARSDNQPDVIVGSAVVDTLNGGAGNDILQGGEGDDTLDGGAGDDILQGGNDVDTLDGGAGNDELYGGGGGDTLDGGAGDDTLEGGAGTDDIYIFESGDGTDTIQGDTDGGKLYFKAATGIDSFSITRNAQDDARIEVGSDSVTIKDFANGKYTLHHGTGDTPLGRISLATTAGGNINAGSDDKADLMIGSGVGDTFAGLAGNDFLYGGEGSDTLYGGIGNDFLYGGAGIDNLHGNDGNDFLYGGVGEDTLTGGAGNDELYGGVGADSYIFGGVHGADTIKDDTDGGKIYFKNAGSIDEFDIARDANGNAVFTLTSNSVTNSVTIEGYEENLFQLYGTVSGVDTLLEKKVFLGTDRGDSALTGSDGNDLLLGLAGVDTLQGLAGDDTLKGGEGNDILEGGAGVDDQYIFEGEHGDDIIQNDDDGGKLYFRNTESVSGIDFSLAGGDLTITVGTNSVEIKSFANDAYTLFYGGSDTELGQLSFGSAGEELRGTENADVLFGLEGVDEITGLGGADRIYGGDGGDTLEGDGEGTPEGTEGADTLYGQKGDDILKGGKGLDIYVFETGDGGDRVEEDPDGGTLYFKDVTDTDAFTFSTDDSGNTKIEVGEDSVTVVNPDRSAVYNVRYGSDSSLAGRLDSGTDGNDNGEDNVALTGTARADVLSGLAGDDKIYGGSTNTADQTDTGNDQLYGGDGVDILYGGDGDDNLFGDADGDTLYGEAGDDTLTGGTGNDFLIGGAGTDTYVFETGDGADTIQVDDGGRLYLRNAAGLSDLTILRDGDDLKITVASDVVDPPDSVTIEDYTKTDGATLDGRFALHYGSADTELGKLTLGTDGDDTSLTGTADADLIQGLEGADTLTGGGGEDQLYGDEGIDTLRGGAGADTLYGGADVDTLYGGGDEDTLYGGEGADTLQGGAGADILYGGDEDTDDNTGDTASYADSSSDSTDATKGVTVSLVADSIGEGADAAGDTLFGIENLIGSDYIDTLTGDDKDNTIEGGEGADTLRGGEGADTLIGGVGIDTLYGGEDIDTLQGGVGADTLTGGEGDDFLEGGEGADTYVFEEGHGEDTIRNDADGGELNFQHATGFDNLAFSRNAEGDVVVAVDGNSGDSVKILSGVYDHGRFTISYGVGNDKAELGRLSLAAETGERAVTAAGDAGKDLMIGSGVRDILTGGGGNDDLYGYAGDDELHGGEGDDFLYGGVGDDDLYGDAGADTYVFEGAHGADTIQGDTDSGNNLYFRNAEGIDSFNIDRNADGDVVIKISGDDSNYVTILSAAYGDGNYILHYGSGDTALGKLSIGTDSDDANNDDDTTSPIPGTRNTDDVDLQFGLAGDDTFFSSLGADRLDGGEGSDTVRYTSSESAADGVTGISINLATGVGEVGRAEGDTFFGIENLIGSNHIDTLTGDENANILEGGLENDILTGGANDDTLQGDEGADTLYGGEGADTLYGDGGDTVDSVAGDDTLYGGAGIDTLYGGVGDDTLYGGVGDDILEGGGGEDSYFFESGDGADTIQNDADGGKLYLENAADFSALTISREGNSGNDVKITIANGDSVTLKDYTTGGTTLDGLFALHYGLENIELGKLTLGTDQDGESTGTAEADLLVGLAGDDTLRGDAGADTLYGGADADTLYGGAGADTLYGGDEDTDDNTGDTASYENSPNTDTNTDKGVTVNLETGVGEGEDAAGDTLFGIENLIGSAFADTLTGDENANILRGGAENDILTGGVGIDTLYGDAGNDELYGGEGGDTLYGGVGDDTLTGGAGNDILEGGVGADTYVFEGEHGDDTIQNDADGGNIYFRNAASFSDLIFLHEGNDLKITVANDDSVLPGSVTLKDYTDGLFNLHYGIIDRSLGKLTLGTDEDDTSLTGTQGADLLVGLEGADTLRGDAGADTLYGGADGDTLHGGEGRDELHGGADRDELYGNGDNDELYGNEGNDELYGNEGDDELYGGAGDDTLEGGAGGDELYGGEGGEGGDTASYANSPAVVVAVGEDDKQGVTINLKTNTAFGGEADGDSFDGIENLIGSNFKDKLTGDENTNTLDGGAEDDTLTGGEGDDFLLGGAGMDTYVFGEGHGKDTIQNDNDGGELNFQDATSFNDFNFKRESNGDLTIAFDGDSVKILDNTYDHGRFTLSYGTGNEKTELGRLSVAAEVGGRLEAAEDDKVDLMIGSEAVDTLDGKGGDDQLYGGAGVDTLRGGAGADTLTGGAGNDDLYGGAGADIYVFEGRHGADTIRNDNDGGKLYFRNAEGLEDIVFSRDNGDVVLTVAGSSVTIENYANDLYSLHYGAADTPLDRLSIGTNEDDTGATAVAGSAVVDLQFGLLGDDTLLSSAGADRLDGGEGTDTASYANSPNTDADTAKGVTVNLETGVGEGEDAAGDTLFGIENLIGSDHVDMLTGDENANTLQGGASNDKLYGGDGGDTLEGDAGNDELYGGAGNDFLDGGAGVDDQYIFEGEHGEDTIQGDTDGGNLYFKEATSFADFDFSRDSAGVKIAINAISEGNSVTILNSVYEDGRFTLSYGADGEKTDLGKITFGTAESDSAIAGTGEEDLLLGLAGDDTLQSSAGADTLDGGEGIDTASYANSQNTDNDPKGVTVNLETGVGEGDNAQGDTLVGIENLVGSSLKDTLTGDENANALEGGLENDELYGGAGDDTLYGDGGGTNDNDAGDDTLYGGAGDDFLDGGGGTDSYVFEDEHGEDTIQGEQGESEIRIRKTGSADAIEIERTANGIKINTGDGDSVEILTNAYADGRYSGFYGAGDKELGKLKVATAEGQETTGDATDKDWLVGTTGIDTLTGLGGDDSLFGGDGVDTLTGGDGDDTLYGQGDDDILLGGGGEDTYVFSNGGGADIIRGDTDGGTLYFKDADSVDVINFEKLGVNLKITIEGADSGDSVTIENDAPGKFGISFGAEKTALGKLSLGSDGVNDQLSGTDGVDDFLSGEGGDDVLQGLGGDDSLSGGVGNDILYGGSDDLSVTGTGNDKLYGGAGIDTLYGGDGADTLEGGADNDILDGGAGVDDTYVFDGEHGADTIQGDDDGGKLYLRNAEGFDNIAFERNTDGDVVLTVGAGSAKISNDVYEDGRFGIYYGEDDTILGKLSLGTDDSDASLTGTDEEDLLLGLGGDDTLEGGAGADTFYGGDRDGDDGTDTVSYATSPSDNTDSTKGVTVSLVAGSTGEGADAKGDTLYGIENLIGSDYIDMLTGDDEENTIDGGEGADTLTGGAGNDFLEGGGGTDTYVFGQRHGEDTIQGDTDGGELNFQHAASFDNLDFSRNADDDVVVAVDGSSDSVKILNAFYDHGRFTISYGVDGDGSEKTELGRLSLATDAGVPLAATDDDGEDLMLGSEAGDTLDGKGGDDQLYGYAGVDTLIGGAGDDILEGGADDDILQGGTGTDTYVFEGEHGADTIRNDDDGGKLYFRNAGGFDRFSIERNTEGNVIITVDDDSVTIENYADGRYSLHYGSEDTELDRLSLGANSDDTAITGSVEADLQFGLEGDDTFISSAGADRLDGGKGTDTVSYANSPDADDDTAKGVTVNLKTGVGEGDDAEGDTLVGIENLIGSAFVDTLTGDDKDNTLEGGAGADTLDGGRGKDVASYASAGSGVRVSLALTTAQQDFEANSFGFNANDNDAVGDVLTDIEGIIGSDSADWLTGDAKANTLRGGIGRDRIEGGAGVDEIYGGVGNDFLYGEVHNDELYGEVGADQLYGGAGNDKLDGGVGIDRLDGGEGNDELYGGGGRDSYIFEGSYGTDTIRLDADGGKLYFKDAKGFDDFDFSRNANGDVVIKDGSGSVKIENFVNGRYSIFYGEGDTLLGRVTLKDALESGMLSVPGDNGQDLILGSAESADLFDGHGGDDILRGDAGADSLQGSAGADTLYGDAGADWLEGGDGADKLYGGAGADILEGGGDNDILEGGAGADTLYGDVGDDTLTGGAGADRLDGGAGIDTLNGGEGLDSYVFESGDGADIIQGDTDGGVLHLLVDAATLAESITFSRDDGAATMTITIGSGDSVTIEEFTNARYIVFGSGDTLLGRLSVTATEGETLEASNDNAQDLMIGLGEADILRGFRNNDRLYGNGGKDTLEGGGGDDFLDGGAGDDTLEGEEGADTLRGGAGADILRGGQGQEQEIDLADYSSSNSGVRVSLALEGRQIDFDGQDGIVANSNEAVGDTLTDIEGIIGSDSADWLTGNAEDNTLQGGKGNDFLEGGAGADTYIFESGDGADTIRLDGDGGKLYFRNAAALSNLAFSRNANDAVLTVGSDSVTIEDYADGRYELYYGTSDTPLGKLTLGTTGADPALTGTDGADLLVGLGGTDTLQGDGGADTLRGDAGVDTYIFESGDGADTIQGDTDDGNKLYFRNAAEIDNIVFSRDANDDAVFTVGSDSVTIEDYANGRYELYYGSDDTLLGKLTLGTTGDDSALTGTDGADLLIGLAGADTLDGGGEADILQGGAGVDTYIFESGDGADTIQGDTDDGNKLYFRNAAGIEDIVFSRDANDDAVFTVGSDSVTIEDYADGRYELYYGAGDTPLGNKLTLGTTGDDSALTGTNAADLLVGLGGADTLDGDGGADILRGGAGADTYVFNVGDGTDTLYDVAGESLTLNFVTSQGAAAEQTYNAEDFSAANLNFAKVGLDLEITLDKDANDGIDDKIIVKNAYDAGTGSPAFTINVQYDEGAGLVRVDDTNAYWNTLT